MQVIQGTVEKIRYRAEDSGYSVFCLRSDSRLHEAFTVVGTFFKLEEGEYLKIWGDHVKHPKYGQQFSVDHYESSFPADPRVLEAYLGNGIIKGIGKVLAKRIVDAFGEDTLDVLKNTPQRLTEVAGIGKRKAELIIGKLKERGEMTETMLQLAKMGISPNMGAKIYREYKENTLHTLQTNPYEMVEKIRGLGFLTMDRIALNNGIPDNSPYRIGSGIRHQLRQAMTEGSVCYPRSRLLESTANLLGLGVEPVTDILEQEIHAGSMVQKDRKNVCCIYLEKAYKAECECARILKKLNRKKKVKNLDSTMEKLGGNLDETQMGAVKTALQSGVMILTGGPGVGKTTTTNLIIDGFRLLRKNVILAAPTGRAAKRMSEATGRDAATIHRTLGVNRETHGFLHDKNNRLECNVVIVDEVSMVDLQLMHALLLALPDGAQLILVGDKNQLPSVGPGNVLSDIISSGVFPVCELTKIYRQADGSEIITNAYSLLHSSRFTISNKKDFFFKSASGPQEIKELLLHYVSEALPAFTGEDSIQVLTPTKGRELGTIELNKALQERLNPGDELINGFRVGDKVINTRNNYDMEKRRDKDEIEYGVFNGDTGVIVGIDVEQEYVHVLFDDGWQASYEFGALDNLSLAYALTIHKSQGSEYPVVVIPIWDYIPMLTTMNLLYTAITRAKRYILLIGSKEKLFQIARNTRKGTRYTGLVEELQ